jgi:hypothetical protein
MTKTPTNDGTTEQGAVRENRRETGVRKRTEDRADQLTDQNAAMPKQPKPYGLTRATNPAADEKKR